MSLFINQVTFDCQDAALLAEFWVQALGFAKEEWLEINGAEVSSPEDAGIRLIFLPVAEPKSAKNRVHLDLRTRDNSREAEVERLVDLGAKELETRSFSLDAWTSTWTVMQDPEGNEFCVSAEPITLNSG